MWTALRSDLSEFVSTVAEESTSALTAIDNKLTSEVTTSDEKKSVVIDNDGNVIYTEEDDNDIDQNEGDDWGLNELILQLENDKNTYTTLEYTDEEMELLNNFKNQQEDGEGNESFVIPLPKEEILKQKPNVADIYNELVPTNITADQFWERYYIRCFIPAQQQEEDDTPANKMISSLFNFAKGAAQQLKEDVQNSRPPFVLNSAVDEEDEEELGWDSDEENEDEKPDSSLGLLLGSNSKQQEEENNYQEQLDQITQNYEERITQLEEERDVLHQTIELQRNEITDLNAIITSLKEQLGNETQEQVQNDSSVAASQEDEPSSSSSTVHVVKNEDDDAVVDDGVVEKEKVEEELEVYESDEDDWGDDGWGDN